MKGVNQTLMTIVVREMPTQPSDAREWFALFGVVASELLASYVDEFGPPSRTNEHTTTIRALNKIIQHYRIV